MKLPVLKNQESHDQRPCAAIFVRPRRRDAQRCGHDLGTMASFPPARYVLPLGPVATASSSQAPGATAVLVGQSGAEGADQSGIAGPAGLSIVRDARTLLAVEDTLWAN